MNVKLFTEWLGQEHPEEAEALRGMGVLPNRLAAPAAPRPATPVAPPPAQPVPAATAVAPAAAGVQHQAANGPFAFEQTGQFHKMTFTVAATDTHRLVTGIEGLEVEQLRQLRDRVIAYLEQVDPQG